MRTPHNSESRKRYFVQAIGGWRFWHASSHEFRTCHFLYHAPRRRLRPERKIFSCGGRRRRWALLHQHPYWIFFFSKEARQHTARRAVACVRTRSYRCVPFGSIWIDWRVWSKHHRFIRPQQAAWNPPTWVHLWEETVRQEGEADAPQSRGGLCVSEGSDWRGYRSSFFWKIESRFFRKQKEG